MSHANAALTPRQRLRLARLVIFHGWPVSRAAEQFNCSWQALVLSFVGEDFLGLLVQL
jgi:hypothetical protein